MLFGADATKLTFQDWQGLVLDSFPIDEDWLEMKVVECVGDAFSMKASQLLAAPAGIYTVIAINRGAFPKEIIFRAKDPAPLH